MTRASGVPGGRTNEGPQGLSSKRDQPLPGGATGRREGSKQKRPGLGFHVLPLQSALFC